MTLRRAARLLLALSTACAGAACLDDIELPPLEPVLLPIINPVRTPQVTLQGTKPPGTGILLGGAPTIEPTDDETWSWDLELEPGDNAVSVKTVSRSGLQSLGAAEATIVYEPDFPPSPTLNDPVTPTNQATQTISGTKAKDTAVLLVDSADGAEQELVALSEALEWSAGLTLPAPGMHALALVAVDARGKRSEPVDFVIDYDVTPPALASKYPDGDVQLPTNGILSIGFDGRLTFETEAVAANVVTVRQGLTEVPLGSISYQPASRALRVHPATSWPASTTLTVTLNHQLIIDRAGNVNAQRPAAFIWTFTTGAADDTAPPPAPVITDPAGDNITVQTATAHLAGTKPAGTGVLLGGNEVLPVTAGTDWSLDWPLPIGAPSTLSLSLLSSTEQLGPEAMRTFTREVVRPNLGAQRGLLPAAQGFAASALERVVDGMVTMGFFGVVMLLPREQPMPAYVTVGGWTALAVFGGIAVVFAVAFRLRAFSEQLTVRVLSLIHGRLAERIAAMLRGFLDGLACFRRPADLLAYLGYTVVYWALNALSMWVLMRGMGIDQGLMAAAFCLCFIVISVMIPAPPGNVGNFHAFARAALAIVGVPLVPAVAYAIVVHALSVLCVVCLVLALVATGDLSWSRMRAATSAAPDATRA